MKKTLLTILFILAIAFTANAWTLNQDASTGADGYSFYWKALDAADYTEIDVGMELVYDLGILNLVEGTRYEFFVTARSNGSESDESDHIRWTMPSPPLIIEMPKAPQQVIINF